MSGIYYIDSSGTWIPSTSTSCYSGISIRNWSISGNFYAITGSTEPIEVGAPMPENIYGFKDKNNWQKTYSVYLESNDIKDTPQNKKIFEQAMNIGWAFAKISVEKERKVAKQNSEKVIINSSIQNSLSAFLQPSISTVIPTAPLITSIFDQPNKLTKNKIDLDWIWGVKLLKNGLNKRKSSK